MKEITNETWLKLWLKKLPKCRYYTTEDWKILRYSKKHWYTERKPIYDPYKLYNVITIRDKNVLWHRIILSNYVEQPEDKPHCNHINWNKLDNRLENLERCDRSHNIREAQRLWLKPTTKLYQFTKTWELVKIWNSISEAAAEYWSWVCNTVRHGIRPWGRKRYKTAKWFVWNTENCFPSSLTND